MSREHAPPEQMFKGFDCDSITVPACDEHNSRKGGNDQAIVSALLIPLANGPEYYSLDDKVKTAIEFARQSFERAKRKALNLPLVKNPSKHMAAMPNVSYLAGSANIEGWVRLLTAALVHNAIGRWDATINWQEAQVWSPDWIPSDDSSSLRKDDAIAALARNRENRSGCAEFSWMQGWSAHPRPYPAAIYEFQLNLGERELGFWHKFYSQYSWYVAIDGVEDAILHSLREKTGVT